MANKLQALRQSLAQLLIPFPRYTYTIERSIYSNHTIERSTAAFLDELGTAFGFGSDEFGK